MAAPKPYDTGLTGEQIGEALRRALNDMTDEQITALLAGKVDKQDGSGLITDEEREKLAALENYNDSEVKSQIALNRSTLGYQRKNLLKNTAVSQTINGVAFTVNEDGSVTANGTASQTFTFLINSWFDGIPDFLRNSKLTVSGCPKESQLDSYRIAVHIKTSDASAWVGIGADIGNGFTFGFNDTHKIARVVISVNLETVFNNLTFYPMLRCAEITDDTYEPYKPSVEERLAALEAVIAGGES